MKKRLDEEHMVLFSDSVYFQKEARGHVFPEGVLLEKIPNNLLEKIDEAINDIENVMDKIDTEYLEKLEKSELQEVVV